MQQCETCGRVKTHCAKEETLLHPLDIKSFMYRWSLDLLIPGKVTPSGHRRILVLTEHCTRFVVAVPLPDKEASTIAWAFRNNVLSVVGAPAEALVDGGGEFEGEFEKLYESCLIDRRVTSPDPPEGNGLTERVVCTITFCLKKCALVHGLNFEWDQFLWAIVLSYNAAKQQSTGVAPFAMLFAQEPTMPPDLKCRPALEFDTMPNKSDADTRVADLLARAEVVRRTGLKKKTAVSHIAPCFLQIKDNSGDDSTDVTVMERWAGKLKRATSALLEKTPSPTTMLESGVGPRRSILKGKANQPWLAASLAQVQHKEEHHWLGSTEEG
ncbi:hypothetical protein CYMTET_26465 [Cymbomonas tetramitiformis]|uniref:Integrase catalytic domain-containing protein n=1 Tax=Cymbomonas tetramitiformis TaxID=36881 RepID=A0AAE0KXX3_9CHLO|nr:hypothetical protein CYMTET_26465 [Cymbomonas tetramitiformis]